MALHTFNHARPDFAAYGFTCELWKAAPMRRPDRHNEIELNLLKQGALTYLFGGECVTVKQGCLSAFWAAIPHQIIGSQRDPQYFVVTLPLAWFLQREFPGNLVDRLLHGQFLSDPETTRRELDIQMCLLWKQDLEGSRPERRKATLLEMEARLRRLADRLPSEQATGPARRTGILGEGGLSKVEQMAAYIALHYRQPVLAADIARQVRLHPNYAMNLFRKTFNVTLNEYVTQHRISHAQRLLATTDDKVVDVALDSGYPTLSRFYEAFRNSCGCSPSSYRKDHRHLDR